MKKYIAVLLALILVFTLAACNSQKNETAGGKDEQQTEVTQKQENSDSNTQAPDSDVKNEPEVQPDNTPEIGNEAANDTKDDTSATDDTASDPDNGEALDETEESGTPLIDTMKVKTDVDTGFRKKGTVYTITKGGEYTFAGTMSEGRIIVNAKDEEVTIILASVDITSAKDSVIYINDAEEVTIKALKGTNNFLTDARPLREDLDDNLGSACVYSKCDLKLQGKGSLTITASYNNGIHSKHDVKIKNVLLTVTAPHNAIKGNDSVTIESGEIMITASLGDGLETENVDISSKGKQRGIVAIEGGKVEIYAADMCIDAAFDTIISPEANVKQFQITQ